MPLPGNLHELFQSGGVRLRAGEPSHTPLDCLLRAPLPAEEYFERFARQGSREGSVFPLGIIGPAANRDALAALPFRKPFVPVRERPGVDGLELTNSTTMLAAWI